MIRKAALVCVIAALTVASGVSADGPSLDDVLAKLEAKGKTVKDFRARFRQEKTVYVLDEPLRSEGTLAYLAPGRLRWETTKPEASTLVIDDAGMKVYMPKLKQLEVYDFSGKDALGAILPLFGQSVADLRRGYEVSLAPDAPAGAYALLLAPKNERVRRAIAKLRVEVDRETLLPRKLSYEDPNGDTSTTWFEDVRPNVGLKEADFVLNVPEGTKVKRPLGGLPF